MVTGFSHLLWSFLFHMQLYSLHKIISPEDQKEQIYGTRQSQHFYRCTAAERTCCTRDGVSYYVININYLRLYIEVGIKQTCVIWTGLLIYKENLLYLGYNVEKMHHLVFKERLGSKWHHSDQAKSLQFAPRGIAGEQMEMVYMYFSSSGKTRNRS